jgi:hypothetical protein
VKPITVTLEKSKETKGTYPFDSPDPNAAITSVYVRERARSTVARCRSVLCGA